MARALDPLRRTRPTDDRTASVDPERGLTAAAGRRAGRRAASQRRPRGPHAHGGPDRARQRLHAVQRDPGRDARDHPGGGAAPGRPVRVRADRERRRSASCRSCGPSGRSIGSRCSPRRRRAWSATARSREVAVGEVVLDDVLDVAAGPEIVVDGVVLRATRHGGRRVAADRRVRSGGQGGGRRGAVRARSSPPARAAIGRARWARRPTRCSSPQDARRFTLTRSELRGGHRPHPHLRHVRDRARPRRCCSSASSAPATTTGAKRCRARWPARSRWCPRAWCC